MVDALVVIIIVVLAFIIGISAALKWLGIHPTLYKSKQIYSDHAEKVAKPFFSEEHLLVGKPDSILHTKEGLVPVEIKSGNRPKKPYFSHIMQLVSYCLLVEADRKIPPKKGLIQYKDGEPFVVDYTDELKNKLLEALKEMRSCIKSKKAPAVENANGNKCGVCKYNSKCVNKTIDEN